MNSSIVMLLAVCRCLASPGAPSPFALPRDQPDRLGTVGRRQTGLRLQLRHGPGAGFPGDHAAILAICTRSTPPTAPC